ncbi:MAG: Gldg family protein [Cyanobacteria bacterium P01_D01_bin.105]
MSNSSQNDSLQDDSLQDETAPDETVQDETAPAQENTLENKAVQSDLSNRAARRRSKNLQALKYLLWPGLMLVTAGLVVGLFNNWSVLSIGIAVAGALLLVAGISAGGYATGQFWNQRSTQASTNAVFSVLSVLLILGLINFVGARYDRRIDLTENQILTLSPASQQVVVALEQPAELLIFNPVGDPADQQLLDNYRRYNPDFTYRYLDPFADPQLSQQLGVETGGEAFLRSGDRTTLVQRITPQEPLSERQLTDKLAQLSQEDIAVVYFLQGHGEYVIDGSQAGFLEAATALEQQNYTVAPLNLAATGSVPSDADVLIIAGPQEDFFENEIIAIRNYLEGGGSVMILIDPEIETGLEVLMSQWGVVPEKTIVIDTSGGGQLVGLGPAAPLVQDYGDHPITAAFGNGRSFFPVARPLQIREVSGVEETPLLFTNQSSHAQSIAEGEIAIEGDPKNEGPFSLGVALSRPVVSTNSSAADPADPSESADSPNDDADSESVSEFLAEAIPEEDLLDEAATNRSARAESRMVVIGNSTFATDGLFSQQLNGDVFSNAVNWLSKIESPVLSIRPKEVTNRRFEITVQNQILLTVLALIVFPLAGLVGAGTLWVRRR